MMTAAVTVPQNAADAATVALARDVIHQRGASEPTHVQIWSDNTLVHVRFDVEQKEAIVASQHSDDVGQGSDDAVWVDLWPSGTSGFMYSFQATPNGTHYESSSENTNFAPRWNSHGETTPKGYVVTMEIPLKVMRGVHSGEWRAQFVRYTHATGEQDVWSYDDTQTNADDVTRAGRLVMHVSGASAVRPTARAQIYTLGMARTPAYGGSTSRVGADISIPITSTTSFFSTFHPDYSNVELDQQSISPTVYARTYSEVRPFFTQGSNFYGNFNCNVCNGYRTILYTPGIPTPRDGYAIEGKQGNFSFASFDALGTQRNDAASVLDYGSPDRTWSMSWEHVAANTTLVHDTTNELGLAYFDRKHLDAYVNAGNESGNLVTDPSQAKFVDAGGGWADSHFGIFASARNYGAQFNPYDGYQSYPGIAGWAAYSAYIWNPRSGSASKLAAFGISGVIDRYQGTQGGGGAQSDNQVLLDVLTKSAWDVQLFSGSNYLRLNQVYTPVSQNAGFQITYHSGLQTDNPGNFPYHGSSATPTMINYSTGRYGDGRLDTWFRNSTVKLGTRGALSLAVDNTSQWMRGVTADNVQWFDSISYTYQLDRNSSFAIGLRKVVGYAPQPNGGGNCAGTCTNVSVAYHTRFRQYELYAAYGDPNTLTTVPQAIFKIIFYAGSEKGT